jgi:glycine cleavage system H protein
MDGYSYLNIFETKGIEYLAIIAFLLLLIPFWVILNRQVKKTRRLEKALGTLTANILKIPQGLLFSANHTWTHLERSGNARVGLSDLLMHITGQVKFNTIRQTGDMIRKGELLAEIDQGGKHLKIYSPISGRVTDINLALGSEPGLVNMDPYGKGWICKIKPSHWKTETGSYYLAEDATQWLNMELVRYKDFLAKEIGKFSPETSAVVLQDGGELRDNSLSELPNELWQGFQAAFLTPKETPA